MQITEWEKYRDTAVFLHAVDTLGKDFFAVVITAMMLSDTPVTRDSFDEEIHDMLKIAQERDNMSEYLRVMLAHAYFDKNVNHRLK
ncbi:hypothetical protein [Pseudodesulfovibrio indicus]|uniref:Uncharacterized protein n=1 Tax=Pseudodesulfovibrio indicus TaxID=1716143 RepID=A0A126QMJ6_9BACT|nr:hypothetical protein [Pseudodesulfovibrio indicus]AMK10888.1 hypothetical protein AWY79_07090 [Pseudodesulfovibrio indicus]TDT91881.1 hypothetical protein EDC59_101284 [Pseudodesulfovibrio indicus]